MATAKAVAGALALLAEVRPDRSITPQTVQVYAMALEDVDDATLGRAVQRALRECKFFPAPAELRELAGVNRPPDVDVEDVLTRIKHLSTYLPTMGTTPPSVETVRDALGDAVAAAYGYVGPARLLAGNETTRAIARREFVEEYRQLLRERGAAALPLPPTERPALEEGGLVLFSPPARRELRLIPRGAA